MILTLAGEPRHAAYRELLQFASSRSDLVGWIVDPEDTSGAIASVLKRFSPHLERVEVVQSWPGSTLAGDHTAERYLYRISPTFLHMIQEEVDGLYEWSKPGRPDDLHMLAPGGEAVLASISHEADAWLTLSEADWNELRLGASPDLREHLPDAPDDERAPWKVVSGVVHWLGGLDLGSLESDRHGPTHIASIGLADAAVTLPPDAIRLPRDRWRAVLTVWPGYDQDHVRVRFLERPWPAQITVKPGSIGYVIDRDRAIGWIQFTE